MVMNWRVLSSFRPTYLGCLLCLISELIHFLNCFGSCFVAQMEHSRFRFWGVCYFGLSPGIWKMFQFSAGRHEVCQLLWRFYAALMHGGRTFQTTYKHQKSDNQQTCILEDFTAASKDCSSFHALQKEDKTSRTSINSIAITSKLQILVISLTRWLSI